MNPIRILKDLLLALHGGTEPRHLAAGFALGAALGLVPKGNLFAASILLLFFLFNVDKGLAFLSAGLFTLIAYPLDGAAHAIGLSLLKADALRGFWTALYDLPIVPLTRFNNSVVLGQAVLSALLYYPLYRLYLRGQREYDLRLRTYIENTRLVKAYNEWSRISGYRAKIERYRAWLR